MAFIELLRYSVGGVDSNGRSIADVERDVIEAAGFEFFQPGDSLPCLLRCEEAVLIGYAYWSRQELQLLDELSMHRDKSPRRVRTYVFDFGLNVINEEDYRRYFPSGSIQNITQTPVVAWIRDGAF